MRTSSAWRMDSNSLCPRSGRHGDHVWHASGPRESIDVWAGVELNDTNGRYSVLRLLHRWTTHPDFDGKATFMCATLTYGLLFMHSVNLYLSLHHDSTPSYTPRNRVEISTLADRVSEWCNDFIICMRYSLWDTVTPRSISPGSIVRFLHSLQKSHFM
jgi:hypothetical protein